MTEVQERGKSRDRNDVSANVSEYRAAGLAVCRVRPGEKRPTDRGWTTRSAEAEEFEPGDGVGLVCGWPSSGGKNGRFLVCVDLDSLDAIRMAEQFLPKTGAVEGRDGKRQSHWWYFVTEVPDWATSAADQAAAAAAVTGQHPGPFKKAFNHAETGERVIDFQGTGGQAVVPPSLHEESGEYRRWEPACGIDRTATVTFADLWGAVCRLAVACGAKDPHVPNAESRLPRKAKIADTGSTATATPSGQVQGTCTRECDVPMAERGRRCERYMQAVDLARSGHGGHDTTFRVARLICNDFGIDDRESALALLREYNDRMREAGEKPWSDSDLAHKIDGALSAPDDPRFPFGCKLAEKRGDDTPRVWDDPARLADGFLRGHTVRFVKQTAFHYRDGAYRIVSVEWLTAQIRWLVEGAAVQEWERKRREYGARRHDLESRLNTPLPTGEGTAESCKTFLAAQKADEAELAKLERLPAAVVPKVCQALVTNVLGAIAARAQLPDDAELDAWLGEAAGPAVFAVANGLLDPTNRTLLPHTPDWFATVRLPVAYDPEASVPAKWLAFLGDVLEGDAERVAVVQEVFGACLDRGYPVKRFAAFVGAGDNGKSVALAVLRFLLGGANCGAVNLDELTTNRFAAFSLFGKLANVVGDQGHVESADEGRLKTLTGGDLVTFEQKGKDPFVAVNRAKLIFACNTMPTFADKSEAVWNRLVAIPFEYTVPAGKKDPAFLTEAYWADELPAILNWALDGLARLRSRGQFTRSAKCEAARGQTRLDSNPARQFLTEEYEYTGADADKVAVGDLYGEYKVWCGEGGFKHPLTKPKFGREVPSAYPQLAKSKVARTDDTTARAWHGLRKKGVTDVTQQTHGP